MEFVDTIVAPITPIVVSPVTAIRISGNQALKVFSIMKKNNKDINTSEIIPNYMGRYDFYINEENLHDDVMAVYFKAPHSFTGEDVVEIYFHGNPILVNAALNSIYNLNVRPAEGGEFSKRAFLNGKIDLTQAESIQELISAKSIEGVNSAYNQLKGNLKVELDNIKDKVLKMKAIVEAKIDFPDEDTVDEEIDILKNDTSNILEVINRLIDSYVGYRNHNKGLDIVLAGKPNVGKSSLMNSFLKEERAIVSSIAGTTRDFIKESLYMGGIPIQITDTAGIHHTTEGIEQIGVERSIEKIQSADLILLLLDISSELSEEDLKMLSITEGLNRIIIGNKLDLTDDPTYDKCDIFISAKNEINMDKLVDLVKTKASDFDHEVSSNSVAITERHRNLLIQIKEVLEKIKSALGLYPLDMICIDLETIINQISEITGDNYTEKVLDLVFSSFCIGK